MDIGEKNISLKEKAQKEYNDILEEYTSRFEERRKELNDKGIASHLDGENHFLDIDIWYKRKIKEIRRKYLGV